jgi:prepilin-type N-terminal cleavage/methylation domain-containing protein
MATSAIEPSYKSSRCGGFTLVEILIVLVIISAMIAVVLPRAASSNESLELQDACLSISEALRYVRDLAGQTNKPTRFVISPKERSYCLQIAANGPDSISQWNRDRFGNTEVILPNPASISQAVHVMDLDGFGVLSGRYCLVFDPARPWPNASIILSTSSAAKEIAITGKRLEIKSVQM